jgi:hypothetical protein
VAQEGAAATTRIQSTLRVHQANERSARGASADTEGGREPVQIYRNRPVLSHFFRAAERRNETDTFETELCFNKIIGRSAFALT